MPRASSPAAGTALPAAPHLNLEYRRALARLRREAEAEIERLIDLLDRIEPDDDLEDDDGLEDGWDFEDDGTSEPNLGASEVRCELVDYFAASRILTPSVRPIGSQAAWSAGHMTSDDREEDVADEPHDADYEGNDEPSLGALNEPASYEVVRGAEGRAVSVILCEGDQTRWAGAGTNDLEDEHDGCEPEEDGGVDDEPHDDEEPDSFYAATPASPFHDTGRFEHDAV